MLRYRGAAIAEFWRALRTLKALQAEAATIKACALEADPAAVLMFEPRQARAGAEDGGKGQSEVCRKPNEPNVAPDPGKLEPGRQSRGPETRSYAPQPPSEPEPGAQTLGPQLYEPEPHRQPDALELGRSLHETAALWNPNEPKRRRW